MSLYAVTCYRCKKTGHHSNEFEEELPKTAMNGSNLPIMDDTLMITTKKLMKRL